MVVVEENDRNVMVVDGKLIKEKWVRQEKLFHFFYHFHKETGTVFIPVLGRIIAQLTLEQPLLNQWHSVFK